MVEKLTFPNSHYTTGHLSIGIQVHWAAAHLRALHILVILCDSGMCIIVLCSVYKAHHLEELPFGLQWRTPHARYQGGME